MKNYLENKSNSAQYITFDEFPIWSAPFGLKLLEHIDYKRNISAIDIGFGTGFPLTEIAMRLGDSCIVYGIDPSSEAIEKTRRKIEHYGINNIKIIEGVAESIPLEDNSIDLVTSNNGLNNVTDMNKAFEECARIIKKDGQLILTMNLNGSLLEFYDVLRSVLSDFQLFDEIKTIEKHIAKRRPGVHEVVSKLHELGFKIKNLEHDKFNYQFSDGTAMLKHYFMRLAFINPLIALLPNEKLEAIFEKTANRLNKEAKLFGGVKLSIPYVMVCAIKA